MKQGKQTSSPNAPPPTGVTAPLPAALPGTLEAAVEKLEFARDRGAGALRIRRPNLSKRAGSGSSASLDLRRSLPGERDLLAARRFWAAVGSWGGVCEMESEGRAEGEVVARVREGRGGG